LVPLLDGGLSVIVLLPAALIDEPFARHAEQAAQTLRRIALRPLRWHRRAGRLESGVRLQGRPRLDPGGEAAASSAEHPVRRCARHRPHAPRRAHTLFDGSARDGIPISAERKHRPQCCPWPGSEWTEHSSRSSRTGADANTTQFASPARAGRFTVVLENLPTPNNPKTSWLGLL